MRVARRVTKEGQSPYAALQFEQRVSEIKNPDRSTVFRQEGISVSAARSGVATDTLAQKYLLNTEGPPYACQPDHALVSTPEGPLPIGQIVTKHLVGLEVYDGRAEGTGTTRVVAVQENGEKAVFRIELKNGVAVEATGDHLVWAIVNGVGAWRRVDEGEPGAALCLSTRTDGRSRLPE